jgi:hypothetical protein
MVLPASCCAFKPRVFDPAIHDLLLPRSINEENMSKALPPSTSTCVEGMREDDGKRSKIAIEHRIFHGEILFMFPDMTRAFRNYQYDHEVHGGSTGGQGGASKGTEILCNTCRNGV